ncbi:unnamed protein product [Trichobilharzia regenti]|nr:unnamed protein product [Trichobilharzia regenti]
MFYKNFFESIPIRFLKKLKMITECNEIYKTEEEELRTKFKAKLSEASMTEYLLNEFKSCYEYQRKLSEDRLKDMQDDNEMSNYVLKVLNYYVSWDILNFGVFLCIVVFHVQLTMLVVITENTFDLQCTKLHHTYPRKLIYEAAEAGTNILSQ